MSERHRPGCRLRQQARSDGRPPLNLRPGEPLPPDDPGGDPTGDGDYGADDPLPVHADEALRGLDRGDLHNYLPLDHGDRLGVLAEHGRHSKQEAVCSAPQRQHVELPLRRLVGIDGLEVVGQRRHAHGWTRSMTSARPACGPRTGSPR